MKKLIYILTIIVFCSCLVTNKYKAYNFSNGGTIYDNYQDHHWAGEYKGKKYKVIVENVNEHQKSFNGRLIINKDTGIFGVGKLHLFFPNRDNKDTLLRDKLLKYNNLTSYNCDTIFLFYRYKESANQVNSHVRIPLLKKENKYFQPFQQKDFISKNELQNYYIIENNGLEGYPIDIGYGNRYILKNKSKISRFFNPPILCGSERIDPGSRNSFKLFKFTIVSGSISKAVADKSSVSRRSKL